MMNKKCVLLKEPTQNKRIWMIIRVCRGRDRIKVGFTTTYAVSAYLH